MKCINTGNVVRVFLRVCEPDDEDGRFEYPLVLPIETGGGAMFKESCIMGHPRNHEQRVSSQRRGLHLIDCP